MRDPVQACYQFRLDPSDAAVIRGPRLRRARVARAGPRRIDRDAALYRPGPRRSAQDPASAAQHLCDRPRTGRADVRSTESILRQSMGKFKQAVDLRSIASRRAMDSRHVARHIHALDIARRALAAGAGSAPLYFSPAWIAGRYAGISLSTRRLAKSGQAPDSPECFLKMPSLFTMVDASSSTPSTAIIAIGGRIRPKPCSRPTRTTSADGCRASSPSTGFSTSFRGPIAMGLGGAGSSLPVDRLRPCHCRYLAPLAALPNHARDCPFCKLTPRYARDPAVRSRFPERKYPQVSRGIRQEHDVRGGARRARLVTCIVPRANDRDPEVTWSTPSFGWTAPH